MLKSHPPFLQWSPAHKFALYMHTRQIVKESYCSLRPTICNALVRTIGYNLSSTIQNELIMLMAIKSRKLCDDIRSSSRFWCRCGYQLHNRCSTCQESMSISFAVDDNYEVFLCFFHMASTDGKALASM